MQVDTSGEAGAVSRAARERMFRAAQPVGRRLRRSPWSRLGFSALASTSAGMAWSMGKADNQVTRDEVLAPPDRSGGSRTTVPLNADFENGFARDPAGRRPQRRPGGKNRRRRAVDRGLHRRRRRSPVSLRPRRGADRRRPRRDRRRPARTSCLTARSEGFIAGRPDLDGDHPPPYRLRRRRRRLSLCARACGPRSRSPPWSRRSRPNRSMS